MKAAPVVARALKAARRSSAEWAAEVADWKRSGKTAREYAASRGISATTLTWWSSQGAGRAPAKSAAVAFLPVHVGSSSPSPVRVGTTALRAEVLLVGGRCVRITGELTLEQFARLLDVVEGGESC